MTNMLSTRYETHIHVHQKTDYSPLLRRVRRSPQWALCVEKRKRKEKEEAWFYGELLPPRILKAKGDFFFLLSKSKRLYMGWLLTLKQKIFLCHEGTWLCSNSVQKTANTLRGQWPTLLPRGCGKQGLQCLTFHSTGNAMQRAEILWRSHLLGLAQP